MLKICMVEACKKQDRGSIGAFYIRYHAELAGYQVDVLDNTANGYDVELISIHHASNFYDLANMRKRAKWRIVGGHPMQNNPLPAIPLADVICIGEGESWIKSALKIIDDTKDIQGLSILPGTIICKDWKPDNKLPATNIENPLPDNPPYLNHADTGSKAWYLEMARGCPYACHYCELGHSTTYRAYKKEHLMIMIDKLDMKMTRKINFYAPDEASHPDYQELYDSLYTKGFSAQFSSMRIDSILKNPPQIKQSHLIRVGIDGLTERLRFAVNKKITDDMIIDYFKFFVDKGHVNFKIFMIIGYPNENMADFDEFEGVVQRVFSIPLHKNVMLRFKFTPLIPQPCTPLKNAVTTYNYEKFVRIRMFFAKYGKPRKEPGFWITDDGLMMPKSHKKQIEITNANENYFEKYKIW